MKTMQSFGIHNSISTFANEERKYEMPSGLNSSSGGKGK